MKHLLGLAPTALLLSLCALYSPFSLGFDVNNYSTSLNYAQVETVKAVQSANQSWCFYTTVRHDDQSWEHYADEWQITDLNGNVLSIRPLAHPHENEQPFTRSKCGIQLPKSIDKVVVRARCNVHGYGGKPIIVDLNTAKGDGYSVSRLK
ncbi:hypothetical protein HC752_09595 [Vibrio sp. S9_S30]|nr:hypothetical protein [Vibrio sp. S9_S30]